MKNEVKDEFFTVHAADTGLGSVTGTSFESSVEGVPGSSGGSVGSIAIGPPGQALVSFQRATVEGSASDDVFTSLDLDGLGPAGFGPPRLATETAVGGTLEIPAQNTYGIAATPSLTWDRGGGPHSGRVYLVYTDAPAVGSTDTNVFVRFSDDNGATWSARVQVNDDSGAASQFLPSSGGRPEKRRLRRWLV